MPRPKVDPWWVLKIHGHAADGHKAPTIHKMLQADAKAADRKDRPSRRTVDNYYADWVALSERKPAEMAEQQLLRWPDAMESGALPWEASAVALELLAGLDKATEGRYRPTIRQCKWAYRLRLAVPTLPLQSTVSYSGMFEVVEYGRVAGIGSAAEIQGDVWRIAYRPWESAERLADWRKAGERLGYDEAGRPAPAEPEKESAE